MPSSYNPARFRAEQALHLPGAVSLRNSCVEFLDDDATNMAGVRIRLVSRDGVMAVVHGYQEFIYGFRRILQIRPAVESDRAAIAQAEHLPLGLALQYASFNLGHQIHHTVAAWAALHAHAEAAPDAVYVPVPGAHVAKSLFQSAGHRGTGLRRIFSTASWLLAVRGLSHDVADVVTKRTVRLFERGLTCFERIEGAFGGLSPYSGDASALRDAAAWQRAVLRTTAHQLRAPSSFAPSSGDLVQLLLVSRGGRTRQITNGDELTRSLGAIPGARLVQTQMEVLSLSEQLMRVASSSILVGVHGMALVYSLFLPWSSQRTALVEIQPPRPRSKAGAGMAWTSIFANIVEPRGVRYSLCLGMLAAQPVDCTKCRCSPASPLDCNVSIRVADIKPEVVAAVEWVRARRP